MNLEKFEKGILKTGFVLENRIAQTLKKQGWSVISSKYYEDDFEDKIREIDLIAYKVDKVQRTQAFDTNSAALDIMVNWLIGELLIGE